MNKRMTLVMTVAVLGGFGIILLMNIAALFGLVPARYISPNDIRGMSVEHNQLLYTLNFDQQNKLVDIFNRAIPVNKEEVQARKLTLKKPLEIQKIIIYRFDAPDIEITPIAFVGKTTHSIGSPEEEEFVSLVFSAPEWNSKGLLEESAGDHLYHILINAYDP